MLTAWTWIKSIFVPGSLQNGNLSPATRIAIVALVSNDEDRRLLSGICERHPWDVHFAGTRVDALAAANRWKAPVILCDRDLSRAEWRDAVHALAASMHGACVILLSAVLDDYLRSEVARNGGYDVLSKPLREEDVVRAIKLAWSYWNSTIATG